MCDARKIDVRSSPVTLQHYVGVATMGFPKPEKGRICVKVINHFGDGVQKVFMV